VAAGLANGSGKQRIEHFSNRGGLFRRGLHKSAIQRSGVVGHGFYQLSFDKKIADDLATAVK
jgi:hypothetical protein